MASAQSLDGDKLSGLTGMDPVSRASLKLFQEGGEKETAETEKKPSDDFRTCFLCKHNSSSRNSSENPVHTWLALDTRDREKHLKHMKNCILTPFLFGRRINYSLKNILWLKYLKLIPITRSSPSRSCLSDTVIEVADLAEEIVDTVLSCLVSEEFLHSSYHTYKELTDCRYLEDALLIGKRSEFVSLMSHCFGDDDSFDNERIQLLSLTVLYQAMKYICQTLKPGDCLAKFEEQVKRREPACTELRLKGNHHFAAGEYQTAVACYSQAIKFSLFDPLLYGNRALSYLKLKKLREALSDAKRAVYLKPEWEKGHYRFAQAYFELGFREKAMAVNAFAQKCCSSTLNLLCQAVVFKREMEESAERNKAQCSSSSAEETVSNSHQHRQACGENPGTSRTKVGSKRNWKIANEAATHEPTVKSSVEKDTNKQMPDLTDFASAGEENNCDKDEDSDLELSDDSIPPLVYDSSDDFSDDDDDSLFSEDSDAYSLPALASCGESDTESESEDDFCCSSDDQVPPLHCMSDVECGCCNCSDHEDDDDDDDHSHSESEDDNGDSDEGISSEDVLRSLMVPPLLNSEVNPFLVLGVIQGFLTAHPEMVNEGSPPALPEVIESLPKTKVTKEQVGVSLSCTICQSDYEEDETVLELPCSHLFHPSCVITWLKMHATCPTCRDVLPH